MPKLDVGVQPRARGAARVDAGTVQVLFHQQLRRVVADLRAHDGERMSVRRVTCVDELPVGLVRRACENLAQQLRADRTVVWNRLGVGRIGDFLALGGRAPRRSGGRGVELFADVDKTDRPRIGQRETGGR